MKNNRESKQEHDNKSHLCNFQIRKTLSLSNFKFQIMRLRLKKLVQNFKLLHSTKISNTTQCAGRMVHLTTSSEAPAPLSLLPPLCGEEPLVQIFKLVKPLVQFFKLGKHSTTPSEAPGPLSLLLSVCGEVPLVQIFK
jgi:hypothetical protein